MKKQNEQSELRPLEAKLQEIENRLKNIRSTDADWMKLVSERNSLLISIRAVKERYSSYKRDVLMPETNYLNNYVKD